VRPKWLALLAVVLLAATGMSLLGQWQLDRARSRGERQAENEHASPRPIGDVLRARQTFPGEAQGARVSARGTWDGQRQLLVADRGLDGRDGFWVLTPLLLADGSGVPVVRGWVADPADARRPSGTADVLGRLEPTEPPAQRDPGQTSGLPAGQVERVDGPELVGRWPYPLTTGYVVAERQTPQAADRLAPVPPEPEPTGLAWRNLAYALQWWAFAAFGLFFWWRLVRDEHEGRIRPGAQPPDPAGRTPVPVGEHGAAQHGPPGAQP